MPALCPRPRTLSAPLDVRLKTLGPASRPPGSAQHLRPEAARARPTDVRPAGTAPRRVSAQTYLPRPRRAQAAPSTDKLRRNRGPRPSTMTHWVHSRVAEPQTPTSWASTLALATAANQCPPRTAPNQPAPALYRNATPSIRQCPPIERTTNQCLSCGCRPQPISSSYPKCSLPCPGSLGPETGSGRRCGRRREAEPTPPRLFRAADPSVQLLRKEGRAASV